MQISTRLSNQLFESFDLTQLNTVLKESCLCLIIESFQIQSKCHPEYKWTADLDKTDSKQKQFSREKSTGLQRCNWINYSSANLVCNFWKRRPFWRKSLNIPCYCYLYSLTDTLLTLHLARWAIPLATSVAILVFICSVSPLIISLLWSVCRFFFKNSIKLPFSAISKTTSRWPVENQINILNVLQVSQLLW